MTLDTQYHYKSFHQTVVNTYINQILKVSLKIQAFLHAPNKKRKNACVSMRSTPAGGLHSPLVNKPDTTSPGHSPAQDVFSNVWQDRQGAGQ